MNIIWFSTIETFDLKISGELEKLEAKTSKDSFNYGTKLNYNEPWLNLVIKTNDSINSYYRLTGTKT